ncbi:MAG: phosphoadenosine phosphosulfate reductase [Pseudonocardiales bacterium]|jgi:phosphoadenosine phosphosulfate reductase|nr:phosphoadenosine phosphosulfate reductase [Pseudonocardiales bacterium]
MTVDTDQQGALRDLVERSAAELEAASATEILRWAADQFGSQWCVTSSMADAVLPHLASSVQPGVDVVFLDTGYHFAETIGMRDAVSAVLPVSVKTILPLRTVAEQDAEYGEKLHDRDPNLCCAMRKVEPLERALRPYRAWASGLRRADSPERADTPVVSWDAKRGMVKLNPIATWSDEQVERYIADNGILLNPLLSDGYGSIGCGPCTRRLMPGEDARAGRWAGTNKTECGLHL